MSHLFIAGFCCGKYETLSYRGNITTGSHASNPSPYLALAEFCAKVDNSQLAWMLASCLLLQIPLSHQTWTHFTEYSTLPFLAVALLLLPSRSCC